VHPSGFCDHNIDLRMDRAEALQVDDPTAANELWAEIERDVMDLAPWVPLVNRSWVNLVSRRLGNFQLNPTMGPLLEQMWVR
jgi:peptide/nickel transport system substrate-binding protein